MENLANWLLVLATALYTASAIVSCVFNGINAGAAKRQTAETQRQIQESEKQQKQIIGVQLYDKRRDALKSFVEHDYDKVYWDVQLLFDDEIKMDFLDFMSLRSGRAGESVNHIKEKHRELSIKMQDFIEESIK